MKLHVFSFSRKLVALALPRRGRAIGLLALGIIMLAGPACAKKEDPYAGIAQRYGEGKSWALADWYEGERGSRPALEGVVFEVAESNVPLVLVRVDGDYLSALAFRIERNFGAGPDKVAVVGVKRAIADFRYDVVAALGTAGTGATTERVIEGLRAIDAQARFTLVGAGADFVELVFPAGSKDWPAVAAAIAAMAPQAVEQGPGSAEALALELAARKAVYIWWY